MIDVLAVKRWERAKFASDVKPEEALNKCLSVLDEEEVHSVYIIAVCEADELLSFSGGPAVGSHQDAYGVLQRESFRLLKRSIE